MSHPVHVERPNESSSAAFWATMILIGLIIGAINFVRVMSHDEGHGTEHHQAHGQDNGHGAHTPAAPHHGDTAPASEEAQLPKH